MNSMRCSEDNIQKQVNVLLSIGDSDDIATIRRRLAGLVVSVPPSETYRVRKKKIKIDSGYFPLQPEDNDSVSSGTLFFPVNFRHPVFNNQPTCFSFNFDPSEKYSQYDSFSL